MRPTSRRCGITMFTAYSFDAVHTVLGDGATFSSVGLRRGDGPGLRPLDPGDGRARAPRLPVDPPAGVHPRAMERWETELVGPLVDRMIDEFVDDGRADLVRQLLFPFPLSGHRRAAGPARRGPAPVPPARGRAHRRVGRLGPGGGGVGRAGGVLRRASSSSAEPSPADDMISVLATAEQDGQRLDDEDIFAFLPPAAAGRRRDHVPLVVEPAVRPPHPTRRSSTPSATTAR